MNQGHILLVAPTASVANTLIPCLAGSGHRLKVTRDFETARAELKAERADLLITELKLDAYNGLQLALRAIAQHTPTVVIGDPDAGLELETEQIGATYVSRVEVDRFERIVHSALEGECAVRRSARTPVNRMVALVNGSTTAQVTDVSYDGLRLEVPPGPAPALGPSVLIDLPMFNLRCEAQTVWTSPAGDDHAAWSCGVAFTAGDAQAAFEWRAVVDSLVSRQPLPY